MKATTDWPELARANFDAQRNGRAYKSLDDYLAKATALGLWGAFEFDRTPEGCAFWRSICATVDTDLSARNNIVTFETRLTWAHTQ